jgi:hypothetical protein
MKRIILLWLICLPLYAIYAQEGETADEAEKAVTPEAPEAVVAPSAPEAPEAPAAPLTPEAPAHQDTIKVMDKVEVIETPEHTKVTLGENEVLIVEENGDTVKVRLGSRGISIIEGDDGTEIKVIEMEDQQKSTPRNKKKKFRPHFAGLEIGLNNYLTSGWSMNLPPEDRYMDLNTGKSWNWNLNIIDYGFGFGTDKIGLATGLGFEFINYNFDGQNSIRKDAETGNIVEYVPDYAGYISKSKMNITYMTAPLILEFQIPAGKKRIHISGGVIGGVKLWSNTKMKYKVSGEKSKEKAKGDYSLSPLRWGFTARVGYRMINLYANYYMTTLFKEDRGPELYPFSV